MARIVSLTCTATRHTAATAMTSELLIVAHQASSFFNSFGPFSVVGVSLDAFAATQRRNDSQFAPQTFFGVGDELSTASAEVR